METERPIKRDHYRERPIPHEPISLIRDRELKRLI